MGEFRLTCRACQPSFSNKAIRSTAIRVNIGAKRKPFERQVHFVFLLFLVSETFSRSTWDVTAIFSGSSNGRATKTSKFNSPQPAGSPRTWKACPSRASKRRTSTVVSYNEKCILVNSVFLSMNDYLFSIAQCAGKESIQYSGYKFYAFYIPFCVVKRFHWNFYM